jgi:hypothetical protein
MSKILFANNATSTIAGSVSNVATTVNVSAGTGALFPSPGAGEYFVMTFTDAATGLLNEIVHVTARSSDTMTIVRAREGTTALNWSAGDLASNLVTAGTMDGMAQVDETSGRLLGTMVLSSGGGVFLPPGTNSIIVEGTGGGAGGGAADVTGSGEFAAAPGGGSGGWGKVRVSSGLTSLVATIGAGGAGGVIGVSGGNGGPGGDTTLTGAFGSIVFPGPPTGGVGVVAFLPPGAVGGGAAGPLATQSGGSTIFLAGGDAGGIGQAFSPGNGFSGTGANSAYGTGGGETGTDAAGSNATGYGAGGSGGLNTENQAVTRNGGAGAPGVLIISCYS